jgi:hypothetical protein
MHPPASFGRAYDGPAEDPEVQTVEPIAVTMPTGLPAVELPLVLAIDPESLVAASRQLTDMVLHAVRAGYSQAVTDVEDASEDADEDPNPPARLREVLAEFAAANEELLRRLGTGAAAR